MRVALLMLVCLVAPCGGSRPAPTSKADPPATCRDACARYAACHEEVRGRPYGELVPCTRSCESFDAASRRDFLRRIGSADGDCERMLGEDLAKPDGPTID